MYVNMLSHIKMGHQSDKMGFLSISRKKYTKKLNSILNFATFHTKIFLSYNWNILVVIFFEALYSFSWYFFAEVSFFHAFSKINVSHYIFREYTYLQDELRYIYKVGTVIKAIMCYLDNLIFTSLH